MTSSPAPGPDQAPDPLAEAEGWWDYWCTQGTSSDPERSAAIVLRREYDRRGEQLGKGAAAVLQLRAALSEALWALDRAAPLMPDATTRRDVEELTAKARALAGVEAVKEPKR